MTRMIGLTDAPAKVRRPLRRDRSAGVTVLFAASIIPMLAVVGLAIDFGIWNKVNAELQLAADTAALNAAKVASVGETKLDTNYLAEGVARARIGLPPRLAAGRMRRARPADTPPRALLHPQ